MEQLEQFVVNNWVLFLALIVILALIFIYELISQKNQPQGLSTHATVSLINQEDATVIDIRDQQAYKNGHILNSIHATESDFNQSKLGKYKDKIIILVCAKGLQSPALATKLRDQEYKNIKILSGGVAAWLAADLPLVKGKK